MDFKIDRNQPEEDAQAQAVELINWATLSRTLANDRSSISKKRIPNKHREKIQDLLDRIADWYLDY